MVTAKVTIRSRILILQMESTSSRESVLDMWVGIALKKLKNENPGLGGKEKLTDAMIDKLQNYYGIATWSNVGHLNGTKKAIHTSFFHCVLRQKLDLCPTVPLDL